MTTHAATVAADSAGILNNGAERITGVGASGGSKQIVRALVAFSVQDIISNESLSVGQLATTDFIFSFETVSDIDLADTGVFVVNYKGFFANQDLSNHLNSWNNTIWRASDKQTVNTGVFDLAGGGQSIVPGDYFNLTGVTESDTANDYVAFEIEYTAPLADLTNETIQTLGSFTLTAVPEPSAALMGGLGLVLLLRRRRSMAS